MMTAILASLAFLAAALTALAALTGTVLRYRDSVLADLVAYRDVASTRDVHFRVFAFGGQPVWAEIGKVRRTGQRSAVRAPLTPVGWRAAA